MTTRLRIFARGTAVLSVCGTYRYDLYRRARTKNIWAAKPLLFLMLNPSTADNKKDDPTVSACMGHSDLLGYNGIRVLNLYAYRSTNPKKLWEVQDPVGPDNDEYLQSALSRYAGQEVVCAWGNHAEPARVLEVMQMLQQAECIPVCFGINQTGMPKHPLYVARGTVLIPYTYAPETI